MSNKLKRIRDMKHLGKGIFAIIGIVWGALVAIYAFYKDEIGTDLLSYLCKPGVVFALLLFLGIFAGASIYLLFKYFELKGQPECSLETQGHTAQAIDTANKKSDSIMDILSSAQPREIIKVGTALSEVLWTTSRKELRIKVGEKVRAASKKLAANTNDRNEKREAKRIEAHVMIEDIGNTTMSLDHGKVEAAIDYIREGLKIAHQFNFNYEASRGHRNLANCYAFKKDDETAANELMQANQYMQKIQNEIEKDQLAFDISYSQAKIYRNSDYKRAIEALERCLKIYEDQDASAKLPYADRVVKIYREMGVIYLLMNNEQGNAIDAFESGRKLATARQNHEDIVRCCTELVKLHIENLSPGLDDVIDGYISEAESHIDKVDTLEHIQAFHSAKKSWEARKQDG